LAHFMFQTIQDLSADELSKNYSSELKLNEVIVLL
jgi:hypothetical protein